MNKNTDTEMDFTLLSEKPIDIVGIVMKYLSHWKWFLLSVIMCLLFAMATILYSPRTYKVATTIIFKDDQRGGGASELNILKEVGLTTQRNNVDNEVEVLKRSLIVEEVVRKLGMYISYSEERPIELYNKIGLGGILPQGLKSKRIELYDDEIPFKINMQDTILNNIKESIVFDVTANGEKGYVFSGTYAGNEFNITASKTDSVIFLPFGTVMVKWTQPKFIGERQFKIAFKNPNKVALNYTKAITIKLTSRTSSVADISFVCPHPQLGIVFLKEYIDAYNAKAIREQIELADKTSAVIDIHLSQLNSELGSVESQVQSYKQSQGLTNIEHQADIFNTQVANIREKKSDVETQYAIVSNLNNIVRGINNHEQLIPTNSGVSSQSLSNQIDNYNQLVLERNKLSRIASSNNQSMIELNNRIETTFNSVKNSLQNETDNLNIQRSDLNSMLSQNFSRIRAIPQQERVFSDIKRQQGVKEALFVYLLQKKEEKYMNMATITPKSTIIDNVYVKGLASPNVMITGLIYLFLGVFIPFIIIYLKDLTRYQISSKEELEKMSSIPVLGEIPLSKELSNIVVKENNNNSINEMIRLLRTNLLYVIDNKESKVINMLSSISGDGKTFSTINLAMSFALLDKKVLIIELDIRKPKISEFLSMSNETGITMYLAGHLEKEELIKPSGLNPNLFVINSGPIPPNPSELLSKPNLDELIANLKSKFDFIIVDTAPVGVVSDSFLLNRIADVNLYIVRSGYTPKKYIEEAITYSEEKRLKKMYFVLNAVDLTSSTYKYGYGKKYGYGYGNGNTNKKNWKHKITQIKR